MPHVYLLIRARVAIVVLVERLHDWANLRTT
jgi:hypothetical protein